MVISEGQAIDRLREVVREHRSLRAAARALGVSAPYLCDCLHGRRTIGPTVGAVLKLRRITQRVTRYECVA